MTDSRSFREISLILVLSGVVFCSVGCSERRETSRLASYATNAVMIESVSAGDYLRELHDQGKLPGDAKENHGSVTSDYVSMKDSAEEAYPHTRIFHVRMDGDIATNNYMLVRSSNNAPWGLQRAWRTDSNGKVIREWPVN